MSITGTVAYMAPEQLDGSALDHRVDVWMLGVVLFEMLTGVLPFQGDNNFATILRIQSEPLPPVALHRADVPPAAEALVTRLCAKARDERPDDAGLLRRQLLSLAAALEPRGVAPPPLPPKTEPFDGAIWVGLADVPPTREQALTEIDPDDPQAR